MTDPRRIEFPHLDRQDATALKAATGLLERVGARLEQFVSRELGATVQIESIHQEPPAAADTVCLVLRRHRLEARIFLDATLALQIVQRILKLQEPLAARPLTSAERGVIAYLAVAALRELGSEWRLSDVAQSPATGTAAAQVVVGDVRGCAWVDIPAGIATTGPQAGDSRQTDILNATPVPIALVIGVTRVTLRQLQEIAIGDAIIFDEIHDPRTDPHILLSSGRLRATATLERGKLTLRDGWQLQGGSTMTDARIALAEGLEIELVAEVGRIQVTGRELLDLGKGSVVELRRPVDTTVDLIAGGRVLARGELIVLEGQLAVRIVETLPAAGLGLPKPQS